MKSLKRSQRRHHLHRIKQRVKFTMRILQQRSADDLTDYAVGIRAHTRKLCSCSICCNTRRDPFLSKKDKRSKQEIITDIYWQEMKQEHPIR